MAKVLIIGAMTESVVQFRGELIRSLVAENHEVMVMSAALSCKVHADIEGLGVTFRPYWVQRNQMNIASDRRTLAELKAAFIELKPDLVLAYTIKPIIWGGIAARVIPNCRFIAMVTGLGYAFQGGSVKRRFLNALVVRMYRFSLRRADGVIFQNFDNRDVFVQKRIVPATKCHVVNGSGIDLDHFPALPLPVGPPTFLLIARLLGEKGIREYAAAARIVKDRFPQSRFVLVGPLDPSPDGLSLDQVQAWHDSGTLVYQGATDDVRPFLRDCHVYCLPSYHEGMPRTVLEALAIGRPVLTTNVSGCKETVVPGQNGWLVPHANIDALVERMFWFLENQDQWQNMGQASRKLAEEKFDVKKINEDMLRILNGTK